MPVTEAQKRATAKYEKENYDKILTRFPKGTKERILSTGADSINAFIIQAVNTDLDRIENHNKSKVYLSGAGSKKVDELPFPEAEEKCISLILEKLLFQAALSFASVYSIPVHSEND